MRICIVAEGSYPYVTGGVSSWIHSLARNMPEHEFVIYAIAAERKQQGKFKYTLPDNIVEVREIFLDEYMQLDGEWGHQLRLQRHQRQAITSLISGEGKLDWRQIFDVLCDHKLSNPANFLMSRDFFDIMSKLCEEKYEQLPFTEMFWTVRSMILPLLLTVQKPLPEADVYHAVSTGYAGVLASLGKYLYNKPVLLTEHGIYSREREEEIIKADWVDGYFKDIWIRYFYTLSTCAYQYADEVITLFGRNREIQIELGCDEEKISIVPNGVTSSDYLNLPIKPAGEPIYIGGIVRVVPIKDIKTMIQSFQIVKRQVPQAKFFIMGPYEEDPDYYEECRLMVELLKIEDVIFTGSINVKEYIGQMDILVLTSISEGQPLAVLEGLAAGKPMVTTDVGSCKELIYGNHDDFGAAGSVVPVMSYERIGEEIVKLCKNEDHRLQMGENGRKRVSSLYTNHNFISSYQQLYHTYGGVQSWPVSVSN
ncbi:GT4 family glycosyltransferase PelF [Paenibacillus kandeliae]|uniref:GT4 family glycosyltransferase PelF n=1 Tax=Paenibacillus kandeliae TaxID=3231269 RepID=UPI0034599A44